MIERDHPPAVHLAHQPRVDPVLRAAAALEAVAADQLGGVGREQLDAHVEEVEPAAPRRIAAIIADIMVERPMPALPEAGLRCRPRTSARRDRRASHSRRPTPHRCRWRAGPYPLPGSARPR